MKKTIIISIFVLFAVLGVFAQQRLPVVAVAPFDAISGITAEEANMITRVFFIRLGNTRQVELVDRTIVERVLREHNFQAGDWSNAAKTAALGEALNTNWIVRGEIEKWGVNTLVTVQFYDIQTFRFMGGTDIRLTNINEAYENITPLVDSLVATISGSQNQTYKIGDRGPGGGIIFFAEGGQYMECSGELGAMDWNEALRITRAHRGGGFTDWQLPTQGQLDLMYQNLKRNNLGGFLNEWYWSSSELVNTLARIQLFSDGSQHNFYKTNTGRVRAVRAF